METKKDIRKKVFAKRRETTQEEVMTMSHIICETVCALPEFQEASCIYAYADYNKEASTRELIQKAWDMGKRVAVPKTHDGHQMTYFYLTNFDQLQPGNSNVPEPVDCEVASEEDALLIVPGVAFDLNRHRVGYGAGFYDRYLEAHNQHPTVAIAFEFQIVDEAPAEETDIFPTKVVTEKRIIE